MNNLARYILGIAVLYLFASAATAHPIPKDSHDRTIVVRLQKGDAANKLRVRVEYRLEVDETTVIRNDMTPFKDEINVLDYRNRLPEYYAEFAKKFATIFAERLIARRTDKKQDVEFRCLSHKERLQDEDGKNLGHLRCDFVFEGTLDIDPTQKTSFFFREDNYLLEAGQIILSQVNETGLAVESKAEPDESLRKRVREDDDRLREISVVLVPKVESATPETKGPTAPKVTPTPPETHEDRFSLFRLIVHEDYGLILTLLLAFAFGSAHALTPGHGKTLVAAYLVGERGTVWHALFLGVVTTLTHTGVVILLAIIMAVLPEDMQRTFQKWIQNGLGLVLGLMIACMGFALLLQRLAGKADHIHLGGGHHHGPPDRSLSWWGLVMLGVTGGIVPCWDAIVLLFYAVGAGQLGLVLPAILAFSAGLAAVLVLIGVLVVQVPRFIEARGGDGKLLRSLPTVSAVAVTLVGVWLCYEWSQGR